MFRRTSNSMFASLTLVACVAAMVGCKGGGGGADTSAAASGSSSSSGAAVVVTPPASSSGSVSNPSATPTNAAPQISGTTVASIKANDTFSFKPAVSDADGDALSFQIQNKPSWAAFSTVTGQLSGTPTATGTFANIVITVTDGKATSALPAFSIAVTKAVINSATLSWTPPTANTDGSTLSDLAGFTIVYGTSQSSLDQSVRIDNATASTWSMDNFPSGTYYFAVKAFTANGAESSMSSIVSKVFN
jgi:hypothetical protein